MAKKDKKRSLFDYIFIVFDNRVLCKANLQSVVALSTTLVEFIACTEAVKGGLWLRDFTRQLGIVNSDVVDVVYCDNQSTIHFSKHHMFHSRSKYIDVKM